MVTQETFKKRVRTRMEKTGERYAAARQALIAQAAPPPGGRTWVSQPEMDNDSVIAATGRGWNEWCDIIEAWPDHTDGHPAIAAYLASDQGLDGWWSQSVTVGFERIVGWRLPHQRADGTFTAGKSKTVNVDAAALRAALLSEVDRQDLFPGQLTELRSKPESKAIRIDFSEGSARMSVTPVGDQSEQARCKVSVDHERLEAFDDVDKWKFYWGEWLEALSPEEGK